MHIFALDFDGVLCDSASESVVTAWRAGTQIWPDWHGLEPPPDYFNRFLALRSLIETGYQTVLLLRLIALGHSDAVISRQFHKLSEQLLEEIHYPAAYLAQIFGTARDEWIERDLPGWLDRQRFYPDVLDNLMNLPPDTEWFILTTKQERFAQLLLSQAGINVPGERIFGLERNQSKEVTLDYWLRDPNFSGARFHFVEDRLATLLRVVERDRLAAVQLYLASWGYNTEEERLRAQQHPRITVWNSESFLMV
ncbi:MAG: HAD family hydrolase [Candidatus Competibacteraceae bacterium]|nr:HAD family hydrolase [Candidatus Competibacteraceae bacterium]